MEPVSPTGPGGLFLPTIFVRSSLFGSSESLRINIPIFNGEIRYEEMAIAWFGKISSAENYADIRAGYNNSELYIDVAIFDRFLWYDPSPDQSTLTDWDAVSLYLNLSGNHGSTPGTSAYRFDAQLNWGDSEPRQYFQAVYRGNGSGWSAISIPFDTQTFWRGNAPNDGNDDRGWAVAFHIPWASLGLASAPTQGDIWGMALFLHDRDSNASAPLPKKNWPGSATTSRPATWGQLRFGLPLYQPPPSTPGGSVQIRHMEHDVVVEDAAVGGTIGNLCPGRASFIWNEWGNKNFAGAESFNIQNQRDVADWPCFAKAYFKFPLHLIPPGKVIRSAILALHVWGGSDPTRARPSFLQVLETAGGWTETGLTWNNAPLALQNIVGTWVNPATENPPQWPGDRYEWDVSLAVARAYAAGAPLNLALYSADRYYHSGKYISASDTEDWNKEGRPTLIVEWGNP